MCGRSDSFAERREIRLWYRRLKLRKCNVSFDLPLQDQGVRFCTKTPRDGGIPKGFSLVQELCGDDVSGGSVLGSQGNQERFGTFCFGIAFWWMKGTNG
jgi:hypothetical protein